MLTLTDTRSTLRARKSKTRVVQGWFAGFTAIPFN